MELLVSNATSITHVNSIYSLFMVKCEALWDLNQRLGFGPRVTSLTNQREGRTETHRVQAILKWVRSGSIVNLLGVPLWSRFLKDSDHGPMDLRRIAARKCGLLGAKNAKSQSKS